MWAILLWSCIAFSLGCEASLLHVLGTQHTQPAMQRHNPKQQMERDLDGLKCPPCKKIGCAKRASKLKCKGGVALDVCDCCQICAKVETESCGGKWNFLGKCDRGLYCQPSISALDTSDMQQPPTGRCTAYAENDVKFKAMETIDDILTLADEALKETSKEDVCQPKCRPDFCGANPRAICSAVDNADQSKSCQQTCQHTSCSACRFIQTLPQPCPHCAKDDFKCIKQFGRCIRKQNCRRRKFPCVLKGLLKDDSGKFQCSVPDCPV